jgi:Pyridoxamine 5'-phosphate oxidase
LFVEQALPAYGTSTVLVMDAVSWEEFEASDKGMAEHVRQRLTYAPCYLATVRPDGFPRVHPVGVHVRDGELVVPMNPTSPKGADIRRNGRVALHCAVEDSHGGGGEVRLTGVGEEIDSPEDFAKHGWITFRLRIAEVMTVRYEEENHPLPTKWTPG